MPDPNSTAARDPRPLLVFAFIFFDLIGFAIVLPLLPSYGARFTTNDAAIGFLVASYSLLHFLLAPWWGRLSDRVGRRPILLIGLFGSAVSYLLFGLAQSFTVLLLSRLVAGGAGATLNIVQAMLADFTPPGRRAQAMGMIGAAFGLGFIVGPAIAALTSRLGPAWPGLVAAGISGANFAVAVLLAPETRRREAAVPVAPAAELAWRPLAGPLAIMFFETLAFTVMYVIVPLYGERVLGYDRGQVSSFYVFAGVVTAVVQGWLVGRLVPRWGEVRTVAAGCLLLAAGFAGLPFLGELARTPGFLAMVFLVAAGTGLVAPSVAAYVSRVAPSESTGRALGGLQSAASVARIVGPIGAGALSAAFPIWSPFSAAAASAACALLIAVVALRPLPRPARATPGSRTAGPT